MTTLQLANQQFTVDTTPRYFAGATSGTAKGTYAHDRTFEIYNGSGHALLLTRVKSDVSSISTLVGPDRYTWRVEPNASATVVVPRNSEIICWAAEPVVIDYNMHFGHVPPTQVGTATTPYAEVQEDTIWTIGDSTAGDSGEFIMAGVKRIGALYGKRWNLVGTENPNAGTMNDANYRDDERDSFGGSTIDQVKDALPAAWATLKAASKLPTKIVFIGGFNENSGVEATLLADWQELCDAVRALGFEGQFIIAATYLQGGSLDSVKAARLNALDQCMISERAKGRWTTVPPVYELSAFPSDDRLTLDGTHPAKRAVYSVGITIAAHLLNMAPVTIMSVIKSPTELFGGLGGKLKSWVLQAVGGSATVDLQFITADGLHGGKGVANANTQASGQITVTTTADTLLNLMVAAGLWEASIVAVRILRITTNPIRAWRGAAVEGDAVEITTTTVAHESIAVGDYAAVTTAGRPPVILLD